MSKLRIEDWLDGDDWAKANKAPMPRAFQPMLATRHETLFSDERWIYEPKLDGIRLLIFRDGEHVELYTRNGKLRNDDFPELLDQFAAQPGRRFVLDGELVASGAEQASFARLQQRIRNPDTERTHESELGVCFYVFDSPWIEGYDIRRVPLRQRKALIRDVLNYSDRLRFTAHRDGDAGTLLEQARRNGWDGIIAKRADSCYRCGRSKRWLKFKCQAGQELVIGGYTDPADECAGLGALLVGYYESGRLHYAGRVGAGFSDAELRRLHRALAASECDSPPFVDPPDEPGVHWVTPDRVAEIECSEWTADGKLRHPAYRGERDDKDPHEVIREGSRM